MLTYSRLKRRPGAPISFSIVSFLRKASPPPERDQRCHAVARLNVILRTHGHVSVGCSRVSMQTNLTPRVKAGLVGIRGTTSCFTAPSKLSRFDRFVEK